MVLTNSQIRQKALATLKGRWGAAMLASFVCLALSGSLASINNSIACASCFITIPMSYGLLVWFLNLLRSNDGGVPELSTVFDGFKEYGRVFITLFIVGIYTVLWTLLFIVPGVIKGLSYSMTTYILKDNPEMEGNPAIELSMAMMEGHKMQLFLMQLNFLMWIILGAIPFGIGLFWVFPYIYTTLAAFYEEVKSDYESRLIAPSAE